MNSQYISALPTDDLANVIAPSLKEKGIDPVGQRERVLRVIEFVRARSHTTLELASMVASRLSQTHWAFDPKAVEALKKNQAAFISALEKAREALKDVPEEKWQDTQYLEDRLRESATIWKLSTKDFFQPIRIAVSGSTVSEPVNQLLSGVGPQAIDRIVQVIQNPGAVPSTSAHMGDTILGFDQPKEC